MASTENLENKIKSEKLSWVDRKPKLDLKVLEKTIVYVSSEQYNTLMQVCEVGGWRVDGKDLPTSLGYKDSLYGVYVGVGKDFRIVSDKEPRFNRPECNTIILSKLFYKMQGISEQDLEEINEYFERTKLNRGK